jgi:hypothetical protein
MICAKSGKNWTSGSGEVENVKFTNRWTDGRTDGTDERTTNDQKNSLEFSVQVSKQLYNVVKYISFYSTLFNCIKGQHI